MTPVWVFPAYPLLLTAPYAGTLIAAANNTAQIERINRLPVALAAVAVQGTGFLLSYMILAAFLYRLMCVDPVVIFMACGHHANYIT